MDRQITVLGVDQGLANIGYCVMKVYESLINEPIILKSGTFYTKPTDELSNRLGVIYDTLEDIVEEFHGEINAIGCERLFYSNARSSSIVITNMVTGNIFLLARNKNVNIRDYPATSIKKIITNDGKAGKDDIAKAIEHICTINSISDKDRTNHEDDAIAIAYTTAKDCLLKPNTEKKISKRVHKSSLEQVKKSYSIEEIIAKNVFDNYNNPRLKNNGLAISDYTKKPRQGKLKTIKSNSKQIKKHLGCDFQMIYYINDEYAIKMEKELNNNFKNDISKNSIYIYRYKSLICILKGESIDDKSVKFFVDAISQK